MKLRNILRWKPWRYKLVIQIKKWPTFNLQGHWKTLTVPSLEIKMAIVERRI